MNDRDFLMWLHERLEYVHNENRYVDYMHRLRAIIKTLPKGQYTPNCCPYNSIEDLRRALENENN